MYFINRTIFIILNIIRFAVDLIEKYWSAMPSTSKDRRQFEKINNSRKNPIKLTAPPMVEKQIPTVISTDSVSSPVSTSNSITTKSETSSVVATAIKNAKQQSTLDSIFGVYKGKGKEKEVAQPPRLPQVIATTTNEDDDMEDDLPIETMEIDSSDDEAYVTPTRTAEQSISISDSEMDTEATLSNNSATTKLANSNKQQQEDYFLKQHEKKRKREELGFDDDSSIESMSPPPKNKKAVVDIEEVQDDEEVIFDEKYAIDPPLDWETQTERVEYIGKEIDQSDLYCLVRW
jgi:hypothetical protein